MENDEVTDVLDVGDNCTCQTVQEKIHHFLHIAIVQLIVSCLIIGDFIVTLVAIVRHELSFPLAIIGLIVSVGFLIEIGLRLFSQGLRRYVTKLFNVLEFLSVMGIFFTSLSVLVTSQAAAEASNILKYLRLAMTVLRFMRVAKSINNARSWTQVVKTHYEDLGLRYVTDQIITMPFPSLGRVTFRSTSIKVIADYLNKKHPDSYLIVNLCREKCYDPAEFGGCVRHFDVENLCPPSFSEMKEIVSLTYNWVKLSSRNVVVIHCNKGNGRTALSVCCLLMKTGGFESPSVILEFLASQQTDIEAGHKMKLEVETPSQHRYLQYFEIYLANDEILPSHHIIVQTLKIHHFQNWFRDVLRNFTLHLFCGYEEVYRAEASRQKGCRIFIDEEHGAIHIKLLNAPVVTEDVRVVLKSKSLPKFAGKKSIYFIFHTSFLSLVNGSGFLLLRRFEIDGPHDSNLDRFYNDYFAIEMFYSDVRNPEIAC